MSAELHAMPADSPRGRKLPEHEKLRRAQLLKDRDRAVARRTVEEFLREFLDRAEAGGPAHYLKHDVFPALCGQLGVDDELFARWQKARPS